MSKIRGRSNATRAVPAASSVNPINGERGTDCVDCAKAARKSKEVLRNGLKIIRVRFRLAAGELPDLCESELGKFLLFQLNGPGRAPTKFPRIQRGWTTDGFPIWQRLGRLQRWEFAHSVSSLKRNLPAGCLKHLPSSRAAWFRRQTTPPSSDSTDPEYLKFVRKNVLRIFRYGWDAKYSSFCDSFIPKPSSRYEILTRGDLVWAEESNRKEYLQGVKWGRVPPFLRDDFSFRIRYKEVSTAGKVRPLGIPSNEYDLLGPLHKTIYAHLTTKEWLLQGPPTQRRIRSVCTGKYQTSVDLVNASDGLNLQVTEVILAALLSRAKFVPGQVRLWAFDSLRPFIKGGGQVQNGQMMGTYLSFPLLCLHSYCAGLWASRGSGLRGILINGDDCAMSSDSKVGSYPPGYEINFRKTMVSESTVEINSTVFVKRSKWKEVRHARRLGAASDFAGMLHMAEACRVSGLRWVDAFCYAGVGRSWRLLPSQLGLPLQSLGAYSRQKKMRRPHTDLPQPDSPVDDRWRITTTEPCYGAKWLYWETHFNEGRAVYGGKEWNPPQGKVLRTYARHRLPRWRGGCLSYRPDLPWESRKSGRRKWVEPATYDFSRSTWLCEEDHLGVLTLFRCGRPDN